MHVFVLNSTENIFAKNWQDWTTFDRVRDSARMLNKC